MGAKSAYVRGLPGQGSVQAGTMVVLLFVQLKHHVKF